MTLRQLATFSFLGGVGVLWFMVPSASASDESNQLLVQWKNQQEVEILETDNVDEVLSLLQTSPAVKHVEPNRTRSIAASPDDPLFDDQYYLYQTTDVDIDSQKAWDFTTGDNSVVIAVIDTGVDADHPDLAANMWTNTNEIAGNGLDDDGNGYVDDVSGWDFVGNDNDPIPLTVESSYGVSEVNHGTHVSGIAGAVGNNGVGITGVSWDVQIMPLRAFDTGGTSSTAQIIDALEYATANGADIINMSYAGGGYSQFEYNALQAAVDSGMTNVAAAGNESANLNNVPTYPACYNNVITVAATNKDDDPAWFTNFGADCVAISAPGTNILSTYFVNGSSDFNSEYGYLGGTSMSTPVVAGAVALLESLDSGLTQAEALDLLTSNVDPLSHSKYGAGRVNAHQALEALFPDVFKIKAFKNDNRKKEISKKTRSRDTTPYFSWSEPDSLNNVTKYHLYFGPDKKNPAKHGNTFSRRKFYPEGVRGNEKTYRLRIKAEDDAGNLSPVTTFKYIADTKIKRPTWGEVNDASGNAHVLWNAVTGEHVVGYYVYRAVDDETSFSKYTSLITDTSFLDVQVEPGHTYKYKVKSVDDLGNESKLTVEKTIAL